MPSQSPVRDGIRQMVIVALPVFPSIFGWLRGFWYHREASRPVQSNPDLMDPPTRQRAVALGPPLLKLLRSPLKQPIGNICPCYSCGITEHAASQFSQLGPLFCPAPAICTGHGGKKQKQATSKKAGANKGLENIRPTSPGQSEAPKMRFLRV